jgi:hypothetical protein
VLVFVLVASFTYLINWLIVEVNKERNPDFNRIGDKNPPHRHFVASGDVGLFQSMRDD